MALVRMSGERIARIATIPRTETRTPSRRPPGSAPEAGSVMSGRRSRSAAHALACAAQCLDRRELLVELGPYRVDVGGLQVELARDLVDRTGLGRRDRAIDRPDGEAAAEQSQALTRSRDPAERPE